MRYLSILLMLFLFCKQHKEPVPTNEQHYVIQKGDNLDIALAKLNISTDQRSKIISSAQKGGFPLRYCHIDDTLLATYKEDSLINICYRRGPKEMYILSTDALAMACYRAKYIEEVVTGKISSSLYESMLKIRETPELVVDFASIFAWEIDFFTETRPGDTFLILLKREYIDSIPIGYKTIQYLHYGGKIGNYSAYRFSDTDGNVGFYDKKGGSLKKLFLKAPLSYARISSYFSLSRLHPILKIRRPHRGIDYAAPRGTPVSALGDGTVTFAGWKGQYGKLVIIKHVKGYSTRYGHLSKIKKGITKGRRVKQGDVIGYVGSTGLSTGPHLHFELRQHGKAINPLRVKIPRSPGLNKKYHKDFKVEVDSILKIVKKIRFKPDTLSDSLN